MGHSINIKLLKQGDWPKLKRAWDDIGIPNKIINAPYVFETIIIRGFELSGALVRYPYTVFTTDEDGNRIQLEQIDGAIHHEGISALIESKMYSEGKPINIEPIAKLRNQLMRRPASTLGLVFSYSGYTTPALELAKYTSPHPILLWEKDQIEWSITIAQDFRKGLLKKIQHAVEENIQPNFDFTF